MSKIKIQSVLRDKEANSTLVNTFNTIKEATDSIETKMDNWKVQLLIADAINTGKRAFGCNWKKIEE